MRPRRRSGATRKIEVDEEPGLAMRILLHSPKDLVAGGLAFAAAGAIVANAMFMQAGHHPSPIFGSAVPMPPVQQGSPLPRPRPVEAERAEPRASAADAAANSVKPAGPHSDPVADIINANRRVAAVQRALTEYGYGQLKPTGTVGTETQAAIRKFEQARQMPVTGQMSDRLVRELAALTGRPID
ncbi:hypothetical protein NB311A_18066 [Nitrobacter sp. Nb-311A]|uniref:peptidoglycan-binding domain-containing protein n=1 Tax=unclassified Nitrobacter TaxID=2620411 RepID=UPI00006873DB|nr:MULTISPECIES: peptidoglycan-binding domain-containing protein [unclassified Nitrobacter]EAQ35396.1 hypothetical protein NB311A_18066 [Nitrobacter sp. Nb-311A]MCB1391893.1 peptidoglycan-binding protein [Nitrobacter sp.]MCV0385066.1 peptidoglycan-binding protein [Nitrobacter sp.]